MHTPIYNQIGQNYNTTRQADPYITEKLFYYLKPAVNLPYLDIGCGTGNYTIALANIGLRFCGVEPSEKMLDVARSRNLQVEWLLGSAEHLPADDKTFGGAVAVLTVHHWANLQAAFKEISRVLIPGAKLVITAGTEQMQGYWLNYYFPQMLNAAIKQMPSLDALQSTIANAGFEIADTGKYFIRDTLIFIRDTLMDKFLYAGKNNPELYFDADVRSGISSFAALANVSEVEHGLEKLRADIASGEFEIVKKRYHNDLGDYLFIAATS